MFNTAKSNETHDLDWPLSFLSELEALANSDQPAAPLNITRENIATNCVSTDMLKPEEEPGFASDGSIATTVPYTPSSTITPSMSHTSVIEKLRGKKSDRVQNVEQIVEQNVDQIIKCPPLSERSQRKSAMDKFVRVFRSPWDKLKSDADKAHRSFAVADLIRTGIALSFTLNLSERRQSAIKESAQPARAMSHEINRALKPISEKNGLKFPYGFVFEVSDSGKLHLHGFIRSPLLDETLICDLDAALAKAGGHLSGKHQITKDTQNKIGWLYDGHGYFAYATKAKGKLRRFFGGMSFDQLVFISDPMRRICRFQEEADAPGESDDSYQTYLEKGQKLLSRRQSHGVDTANRIAKPHLPSISSRKEVFEQELFSIDCRNGLSPICHFKLISLNDLGVTEIRYPPIKKRQCRQPASEAPLKPFSNFRPIQPFGFIIVPYRLLSALCQQKHMWRKVFASCDSRMVRNLVEDVQCRLLDTATCTTDFVAVKGNRRLPSGLDLFSSQKLYLRTPMIRRLASPGFRFRH